MDAVFKLSVDFTSAGFCLDIQGWARAYCLSRLENITEILTRTGGGLSRVEVMAVELVLSLVGSSSCS